MKHLLLVMLVFFVGKTFALPPCSTSGYSDNSFGAYKYDDWGQYVGEWRGELMDGYGTYTFADGHAYEGEWKNNKRHGEGIETFSDGRQLVGE